MNNAVPSTRVVISQKQGSSFPFVLPDQSVKVEHLAPETLLALLPTGTILQFGGTSVPYGFLICDGSTLSRAVYSNLFGAIGTTYGAPDGTTFKLPDVRGRVQIGEGAGPGLSARSLGQTVGEEAHLLSGSEMPVHSHGVNDPGHSHAVRICVGHDDNNGTDGQNNGRLQNADIPRDDYFGGTTSSGTNISLQNAGGNASHNNMQPSLVTKTIIKY